LVGQQYVNGLPGKAMPPVMDIDSFAGTTATDIQHFRFYVKRFKRIQNPLFALLAVLLNGLAANCYS
jgi:hypothetical protein